MPCASTASDPVHFFSAGRRGNGGSPGSQAPVVVGVAQLVEHLVVVQDVAGSSPVTHPECAAGDPVPRNHRLTRFRGAACKPTPSAQRASTSSPSTCRTRQRWPPY